MVIKKFLFGTKGYDETLEEAMENHVDMAYEHVFDLCLQKSSLAGARNVTPAEGYAYIEWADGRRIDFDTKVVNEDIGKYEICIAYQGFEEDEVRQFVGLTLEELENYSVLTEPSVEE